MVLLDTATGLRYDGKMAAQAYLNGKQIWQITPSVTPSLSSIVVSPSFTPSYTVSETPSITPSYTVSETPLFTPSYTVSETPLFTPSYTVSETPSVTLTEAFLVSLEATPSLSIPESQTPVPTPSRTESQTPTPTRTPTLTPSLTRTPITPSQTRSETPTPTITPSVTRTPTQTRTYTPTPSETPSYTPSRTLTPTITPTTSEIGTRLYSNFNTYIVDGVRQATTGDLIRTNISSTRRLIVTSTTNIRGFRLLRIPPDNWSTTSGYGFSPTLSIVAGTGATIDGGTNSKSFTIESIILNPSDTSLRTGGTSQYDISTLISSSNGTITLTAGEYNLTVFGKAANMTIATLTTSLFPIDTSGTIYPSGSATYFPMEIF